MTSVFTWSERFVDSVKHFKPERRDSPGPQGFATRVWVARRSGLCRQAFKMKPKQIAKILEIGPYPPPLAGWSIRIRFIKERLTNLGHDCKVLNIGKNRQVPSDEYLTVRSGLDYVIKTFSSSAMGYTHHVHTNGDGPIGFVLSLIAAVAGFVFQHRIVLSFHAGVQQKYFPRERSKRYVPIISLFFRISKYVLCDSEAVKTKIVEYGINPTKVIPIQTFGTSYIGAHDVALSEEIEAFVVNRDPVIFTYAFLREGFYLETLVKGMQLLVERYPNIGLVNAGAVEDNDPPVKKRILRLIDEAGIRENICFAGDLSHDQFVTLMRRTKLYLRTPKTDGECASVLEALTVGIPVVAAENGNRPPSVVTYTADDAEHMCQAVVAVLSNHAKYCDSIIVPTARDTIAEEVNVLIAAAVNRPV